MLGGSSLALCIGSAVLVVSLEELPKPTLANLLGALAIDKALLAMRASGSGSDNVLSAPAAAQQLLGSTVAVNPAALAAARVLHPDEIAALTEPFGGAARPIDCRMELEEPTELGQWLVEAKEVHWKVKDEAADAAIAAEERRVWQAMEQPAAEALSSEAAMQQLLEPLFGLRRSSGLELSPRLIANLLMLAAGVLRGVRWLVGLSWVALCICGLAVHCTCSAASLPACVGLCYAALTAFPAPHNCTLASTAHLHGL